MSEAMKAPTNDVRMLHLVIRALGIIGAVNILLAVGMIWAGRSYFMPKAEAQEWSTVTITNRTIRWSLDWWRRELTNDHSNLPSGMPGLVKEWVPQGGLWNSISDTNSVELGYRSDGMVVWRKLPEARP